MPLLEPVEIRAATRRPYPANRKSFVEHQADYVAMRIISAAEPGDALAVAFNRYEIRTPGVEVTMN